MSDPSIPDRINYANLKENKKLAEILENKIQQLLLIGATHIMICCFTAHYFISLFSKENQKNLIHLGVILEKYLEKNQKPTVILCSNLLKQSKLIDSEYAIYPEESYFSKIHDLIYKIKLEGPDKHKHAVIVLSEALGKHYQTNCILFACTEFHLIYQALHTNNNNYKIHFLDGLDITANFIINLCAKK